MAVASTASQDVASGQDEHFQLLLRNTIPDTHHTPPYGELQQPG